MATSGLDGLSLRKVAQGAGTSTTAIFQNFKDKADLLVEAVDHAVRIDAEFHAGLRRDAFSLISGQLGLADFITAYVQLRAGQSEARFLSEVLVKLPDHPQCHDAVQAWQASRVAFWQELLQSPALSSAQLPSDLPQILGKFLIMEELYAFALNRQMAYRLLLTDTCRALCDAAFSHGGMGELTSGVSAALGVTPFAVRPPKHDATGSPVPEQLIKTAVEIINEAGIRSLNQRALAARAGVSPSVISYHFTDMKTLTTQAIWRALVQGIPAQFDPDDDASPFPQSLDQWLKMAEAMLQVGDPADAKGFYVNVSRLSAETCFLAGRTPQLLPLIAYLRGLEGWGTYRMSQAITDLTGKVRRDHAAAFGVWIKSEALLRNAGIADGDATRTPVAAAARIIFPSRRVSGQG